jgi:hypothetical protein
MSTNESFSSTIGIELTWAVQEVMKRYEWLKLHEDQDA